jgi:hypothetical protein
MWGSFKTSLLPSNLSLPPPISFRRIPPATPMASQQIELKYKGTGASDTVTFKPVNYILYASLLSSSHTLGSDFSHDRSNPIDPYITKLNVYIWSKTRTEVNDMVQENAHNKHWLKLKDAYNLRSIFELNHSGPNEESIAWAPYDAQYYLGEGIMIFKYPGGVMYGVVCDQSPFTVGCK